MTEFSGATGLLSKAGFDASKNALGAAPCALWSLLTVETRGYGFLPSRRPKILFERHIFGRLTGHRFDAAHPAISARNAGGYQGGEAEYDRLEQAMALDRSAALQSASWGLGQVMGFNAIGLGYKNADAMIAAFCDGEDAQLDGVTRFVRKNPTLLGGLQSEEWVKVASIYNGPDYARNEYPEKLAHYFDQYSKKGVPDIEVRSAQARLTALNYAPGTIDGIVGTQTIGALNKFQRAQGLPVTQAIDAATQAALRKAAGF